MILLIFTSFIIFIKGFLLLFLKLFTLVTIMKVLILSINSIIIFYVYTYPKRQRRKLSGLRAIKYKFPKQYILKSNWDHLKNILVLTIYPCIFIIGILWLRFKNTTKHVDLLYYYYEIQTLINITSLSDLILNILVILSIFALYMTVLKLVNKYIKFELIKRHIYLSQYDYYNTTIIIFLTTHIDLTRIVYYIRIKISTIFYYLNIKKTPTVNVKELPFYKHMSTESILESKIESNKTIFEEFITNTIQNLTYYYHHIVLFIVILYDIKCNALILEHMFTIFPYIFIYEILVRITKFLQGLNITADNILYHFLYSPITAIDEDTYQVGPHPITNEDLNTLFKEYVYTDLNYDYVKNFNLSNRDKVITIREKIQIYINMCVKKLKNIYIDPLK